MLNGKVDKSVPVGWSCPINQKYKYNLIVTLKDSCKNMLLCTVQVIVFFFISGMDLDSSYAQYGIAVYFYCQGYVLWLVFLVNRKIDFI